MIDVSIIRENYSKMLDSQLIVIAQNDGHELTPEAFNILAAEFQKRNLDNNYLIAAEQNKISIHQQKIVQFAAISSDAFMEAIWKYVLEEKDNGTPDHELLVGLTERGMDEFDASQVIAGLPGKLKEAIELQSKYILIAGAVCAAGIFISLYSYTAARVNGGSYFIITGAVLFGGARLFKGLSEKKKYQRILKNTTT